MSNVITGIFHMVQGLIQSILGLLQGAFNAVYSVLQGVFSLVFNLLQSVGNLVGASVHLVASNILIIGVLVLVFVIMRDRQSRDAIANGRVKKAQ